MHCTYLLSCAVSGSLDRHLPRISTVKLCKPRPPRNAGGVASIHGRGACCCSRTMVHDAFCIQPTEGFSRCPSAGPQGDLGKVFDSLGFPGPSRAAVWVPTLFSCSYRRLAYLLPFSCRTREGGCIMHAKAVGELPSVSLEHLQSVR